MGTKPCTKCGGPREEGRVNGWCYQCMREYNLNNPDKVKQWASRHYLKHHERYLAYFRERYKQSKLEKETTE